MAVIEQRESPRVAYSPTSSPSTPLREGNLRSRTFSAFHQAFGAQIGRETGSLPPTPRRFPPPIQVDHQPSQGGLQSPLYPSEDPWREPNSPIVSMTSSLAGTEEILFDSTLDPEISEESAGRFPFLRRFMHEVYGIETWEELNEIESYQADIEKFFEQELKLRGLSVDSLNGPEDWVHAERRLQAYDEPNLSKIMEVLVPLLRKKGVFKKPNTVEDVKSKQKREAPIDCFKVLWELTYCPMLLNRITELDCSGKQLTEIPLSFCRLHFCNLRKLSLANNDLTHLPPVVVEEFPMRKVSYFFEKYPSLEYLNLSGCKLKSIDGVFSFLSPRPDSDERESVSILPNLAEVDFSDNYLTSFPEEFGISPDERPVKKVVIRFKRNTLITRIEPQQLARLAKAAPIEIHLDLTENLILPNGLPDQKPANVTWKVSSLATAPPPPLNPEAEEKKSTFKKGDIVI